MQKAQAYINRALLANDMQYTYDNMAKSDKKDILRGYKAGSGIRKFVNMGIGDMMKENARSNLAVATFDRKRAEAMSKLR